MMGRQGTLKMTIKEDIIEIFSNNYRISFEFVITVLSGVVTANDGRR
jgi:hypothetical protein